MTGSRTAIFHTEGANRSWTNPGVSTLVHRVRASALSEPARYASPSARTTEDFRRIGAGESHPGVGARAMLDVIIHRPQGRHLMVNPSFIDCLRGVAVTENEGEHAAAAKRARNLPSREGLLLMAKPAPMTYTLL
jgi:hypothetical protein